MLEECFHSGGDGGELISDALYGRKRLGHDVEEKFYLMNSSYYRLKKTVEKLSTLVHGYPSWFIIQSP